MAQSFLPTHDIEHLSSFCLLDGIDYDEKKEKEKSRGGKVQNEGLMRIEMGRLELSMFVLVFVLVAIIVFVLFEYWNRGSKVFLLINARHRATIRHKDMA